jgi:hypothetical protein
MVNRSKPEPSLNDEGAKYHEGKRGLERKLLSFKQERRPDLAGPAFVYLLNLFV